MARELRDMVCVITGASSGIGEALAVELARGGARLVLAARRLDRLEDLNRRLGGGHLCLRVDVSKEAECRALMDAAVGRFGRIDTLVCNAGYGLIAPADTTTAEQYQRIFQTNLFGTTDCIRAVSPVMQGQNLRGGWRGQIVIVSSGLARRAAPASGAYSATKAAQLSIAESLRVTLRPARIAVTSVHPVMTDTEFFESAEREGGKRVGQRSWMEVLQSPQTVARAIVGAIRRPRPEVWPHALSRWGAVVAIMFPRLGDWVMERHRKSMR